MSDGGEFKESGFLRVDRERALKKLALFAMPRGEMFLLPLVRCAVAAGAGTLSAEARAGELELSFDGEPLPAAALKDPYGGLLSEEGPPAARHLAVGLLTAMRTGPARIVVESGAGAARLRLVTSSARSESVEPALDGGRGTAIRVVWPLWKAWRTARRVLEEARSACPLVPAGFLVGGKPLQASEGPFLEESRFASGDLHGLVRLPGPGASHSLITFCQGGVAVQGVQTWLPWAQVRAWVDDPGFRLSASQSGVVEDERRRAALDAVTAASRDFLVEAARKLAAARPHGSSAGSDWGPFAGLKDWLREVCGRLILKDPETDSADPVLAALWNAPVLLDVCYKPLTLAELHAAGPAEVRWSQAACPGSHPPERIAWCPDEGARALLKARFGAGLRDMTKLIESLSRAR